jgi:outer membrane protein assembly factor BamB
LVTVATAGGVLSARTAADGTEAWRVTAPAADGPSRREFGSRAATGRGFLLREGTLFAISGRFDGLHRFGDAVHAVDPVDGTERWRYAPGRSYAAFGIVGAVDGAVVVGDNDDALGSGDHRTVAIDAATGGVRWSNTSGDVLAGTVGAGAAVTADATTLSAYDAGDGAVRWTRDLPGVRWLDLVGGASLYAGVGGSRLVAVDPATGETRWELAADAGDAIVDEAVYLGGARVRRVAPDGDVVWASDPPELERLAALGPDRLFVAGEGVVGALSRSTGAEEWRIEVDASYTPTVTAGDGSVVVGTETTLTAVDAATGERRWTFAPGVGAPSETTVGESTVYVAASPGASREGPGRVYARPVGE